LGQKEHLEKRQVPPKLVDVKKDEREEKNETSIPPMDLNIPPDHSIDNDIGPSNMDEDDEPLVPSVNDQVDPDQALNRDSKDQQQVQEKKLDEEELKDEEIQEEIQEEKQEEKQEKLEEKEEFIEPVTEQKELNSNPTELSRVIDDLVKVMNVDHPQKKKSQREYQRNQLNLQSDFLI